jgi:hypothetical protein
MKYWIEKTLVNGRKDRLEGDRALGKALWSPQKDKRGADIYKSMREVEIGDVIIHLVDNSKISGVSIVETNAIESTGIFGTEWDRSAYLIQLRNYEKLNPEISRDKILSQANKPILDEINRESEVFYNSKLELRQGAYLTPCPNKLITLINNIYISLSNSNLPHVRFSDLPKIDTTSIGFFNNHSIKQAIKNSGLAYSDILIIRFTASLLTKPFVILTGLSGSGKTKLAQAFVQWISKAKSQYKIVPVGADWTNREPLLGYPNALNPKEYVKPDSGVLDLIIQANTQPDLPYFLILDEMNLSHVERYFADFLSVMESKEGIPLHSGEIENGVPARLKIPSNLFIIGTVNIDETTNMFSPKVLDRANTIEFRLSRQEMEIFLAKTKNIDMEALTGKGAGMAKSFLELAADKSFPTKDNDEVNDALIKFFGELSKTGAEFGYRSASEILRLIHQLTVLDNNMKTPQKIDIAIVQKLLPKLHGSQRRISSTLKTLGSFCVSSSIDIETILLDENFDYETELYPLSLEKIARMYRGALANGFTSFAEA